MSIYRTKNISRERAQQEILRRVMAASNDELGDMLFSATRSYGDPLCFNNFRVDDDETDTDEETE